MQLEGGGRLVEGFLDGATEAQGGVERGGEDRGGAIVDGRAHADDVIDVRADRLGLDAGVAGVEHDDADVVFHVAEQFGQRFGGDPVFAAGFGGQGNLAGGGAVAAEVHDLRAVLVQVLQEVV